MDPLQHPFNNDAQFFNDQSYNNEQSYSGAEYGNVQQFGSSGLTPYYNGVLNDGNVFDNDYATYSQFDYPNMNSFDMSMSGMPLTDGNFVGFNPQMAYGLKGREHSSASSESNTAPSPQLHLQRSLPSSSNSGESASPADSRDGVPTNSAKRNRFLERNRLAAAKCRTKKKEWTNNLEAAARQASQQTRELHAIVQNLRNEVQEHKALLQSHQGCDCHPIHEYLQHHGQGNQQS